MTALRKLLANIILLPVAALVWLWMFIVLRMQQPMPEAGRLLLLLSQVAWDDVWQRPQEFAMRAAKSGRRVVFYGPIPVHTWLQGSGRGKWRPIRRLSENLLVLSPLVIGG